MKLHEYETSTGYTLRYRVLALDIQAKIDAAVRAEWATSDDATLHPPQPKVSSVETAPGVMETITHDKDPDHLKALAAYDERVKAEIGRRTLRLISDYAIVCEIDHEAVAAHLAALATIGVDLSAENPRDVFLYHIALPDSDEQELLSGRIFGAKYAAYVEAQRRAFRRQVEGAADRISLTA